MEDDWFDPVEFEFDFTVAVTMMCEHVDYDTAAEMVREEMREEREEMREEREGNPRYVSVGA